MANLPPVRAAPGTALLLDAAGTLLRPAVPVADTYAHHARAASTSVDVRGLAQRFTEALRRHRALRVGDPTWRRFWAEVVADVTGCRDRAVRDRLYLHYAAPDAWVVAPGAEACCVSVRERGMRVAIVSNWDTRLRELLRHLGVTRWVDDVVVSGEVGLEKPDPRIFQLACSRLGVVPAHAVHVGDDMEVDVRGALGAGLGAWHYGREVVDFDTVCERLIRDDGCTTGHGSPRRL